MKNSIYFFLTLHKVHPRTRYRKAFSTQKRTSSTSKYDIHSLSLVLRVIFALVDSDPADRTIADPDPHMHCFASWGLKKYNLYSAFHLQYLSVRNVESIFLHIEI
jgi:hypothetical protein